AFFVATEQAYRLLLSALQNDASQAAFPAGPCDRHKMRVEQGRQLALQIALQLLPEVCVYRPDLPLTDGADVRAARRRNPVAEIERENDISSLFRTDLGAAKRQTPPLGRTQPEAGQVRGILGHLTLDDSSGFDNFA